ncbi:MAG: isoaspartyl peptidase/L-asparaginase [Acidobacteria bacterium]|nr:isoaspartyl peptidase/L-asparaginase [Acidobacteriota bacterium]
MRNLANAVVTLVALTLPVQADEPIAIVIHGGAGTITRENMTPELEKEYREILSEVLDAGYAILRDGGSSLDAVETAIRIMEDSPLFNAGKGAVFTADGRNELDASIMDGSNLDAGAVAAVTMIRNPISAARAVMEKSPHVILAGRGADLFATGVGLEVVAPEYFWTERRWKSLQNHLRKSDEFGSDFLRKKTSDRLAPADDYFGTVGAVAIDQNGNIAAGTSTGGLTGKRFGRVGDSPIVGAGTWADNRTCGVSGTGQGEYFIRLTIARTISAMMEFGSVPLEDAAAEAIRRLGEAGATGGVIALSKDGTITAPFNTSGMYRGWIDYSGEKTVAIYGGLD